MRLSAQAEVQDFKRQVDGLEEKNRELEQDLCQLGRESKSLHKQLYEQQQTISNLSDLVKTLNIKNESLEKEKGTLKIQVTEDENTHILSHQQLVRLQDKNRALELENHDQFLNIQNKDSIISRLHSANASMAAENKEQSTKINDQMTTSEHLSQENKSATKRIFQLSADLE